MKTKLWLLMILRHRFAPQRKDKLTKSKDVMIQIISGFVSVLRAVANQTLPAVSSGVLIGRFTHH